MECHFLNFLEVTPIADPAIVNGREKFNSVIEKKIHKDSFKKIKLILNKKFPKLKLSFKILSLRD